MKKPKIKDVIVEDKKTGLLIIYQPKPEKGLPPKPSKFQEWLEEIAEERLENEAIDWATTDFD
jgi:hypothetical protein